MKAIKNLNQEDLVYLDIETVRIVDTLEKGTPLYESWEYKQRYSREAEKFDGSLEEQFENKAALYAEFAKIVCVTIGKVKENKLVLKSYSSHDEKELLTNFCNALDGLCARNKNTRLVTHAGIGFDVPFLMRRCLVNGIELPSLIDIADEKPWLLTIIDTLNLWKGTGFYSASLLNIATAFGIPSPKSNMMGSETSDYYWRRSFKEGEPTSLERITSYCEEDVLCLANIVRKIRNESLLEVDDSDIKEEKVGILTKVFNTAKISDKEIKDITKSIDTLVKDEQGMANEIFDTILKEVK